MNYPAVSHHQSTLWLNNTHLVLWSSKYSSHHYVTSSLNCWCKAGYIHAFMLFGSHHANVAAKWKLIRPGHLFCSGRLPLPQRINSEHKNKMTWWRCNPGLIFLGTMNAHHSCFLHLAYQAHWPNTLEASKTFITKPKTKPKAFQLL